MKLRIRLTAVACFLWLSSLVPGQAAEGDDLPRVGNLGRLSNMAFEGEESFSERELRRVLQSQLSYVLAADPDQPLPRMLEIIQKVLRAGYQRSGFGDAKVAVGLNSASNQVVVRITEGPQLYCGAIRIEGLKTITTNALLTALLAQLQPGAETNALPEPSVGTSPTSAVADRFAKADREALWGAGQPAPLDATSWAWIENAVTNAFWDLGYPMSEFTVDFPRCPAEALSPTSRNNTNRLSEAELEALKARTEGRVVDMLIRVDKEGPRCTVVELVARGSHKNTSEDIAKYLNFRPGEPFTQSWRKRQTDRLWDSARFTQVTGGQEGGETDGRVTAVLHLEDLPEAPPLSEPLPPEAQTLLAMRRWVSDWTNRTEDMVWRFREGAKVGKELEFIFSPAGNVVFRVLDRKSDTTNTPFQAIVRPGCAGLHFLHTASKFVNTNFHSALQLGFEQSVAASPDDSGNRANVTLFFGFQTRGENKPPLALNMRTMPAVFPYLVKRPGFVSREENGVLTCTYSNAVLRVEAATGRLISIVGRQEMEVLTNWVHDPEWSLAIEPGCFARAEGDWARTTDALTNVYDSEHPLASGMTYLAAGAAELPALVRLFPTNLPPETVAAATRALSKLLGPAFFASLERFLPETDLPEERHMATPILSGSATAQSAQAFQTLVALLFVRGPAVVPTNSWLEVAFKLPLLRLAGHGEHLGPQLNRLITEQRLGPLASLVIGNQVPNPQAARHFGITGLLHTDSESFLKDAAALTDTNVAVGQMVSSLSRSLAELDPKEVDALAAGLSEQPARLLRETAHTLRQAGNKNGAEVMRPLLEQWWNASLKESVKTGLRKLTRASD